MNNDINLMKQAAYWSVPPDSSAYGDKQAMINCYRAELNALCEFDMDCYHYDMVAWPIKLALYALGEVDDLPVTQLKRILDTGLSCEQLKSILFNYDLINRNIDFFKACSSLNINDMHAVSFLVSTYPDYMYSHTPIEIATSYMGSYSSPQEDYESMVTFYLGQRFYYYNL